MKTALKAIELGMGVRAAAREFNLNSSTLCKHRKKPEMRFDPSSNQKLSFNLPVGRSQAKNQAVDIPAAELRRARRGVHGAGEESEREGEAPASEAGPVEGHLVQDFHLKMFLVGVAIS